MLAPINHFRKLLKILVRNNVGTNKPFKKVNSNFEQKLKLGKGVNLRLKNILLSPLLSAVREVNYLIFFIGIAQFIFVRVQFCGCILQSFQTITYENSDIIIRHFYQHQLNKQPLNTKKTITYGIGNLGQGLGQA